MAYNKKIIASFVLIIALLNVPFVQTAQASDFGASVWARYFKDVIIKAAAQSAFKLLSNKIIEKIQSGGPDGKAAFVTSWINFETNAQYQGEDIFRGELTKAKLCDYFSKGLKATFGVKPTDSINIAGQNVRTGSLETYGLKTNCTLPSNFNISDYQKSFSKNGGWNAFSRMLEPQNNYYGTLFASLDEIARQRNLSQSAAVNNATAGKGFTGLLAGDKGCTLRGSGNKCLIEGEIKTPGSNLADAVTDTTSRGGAALLAAADGASIAVSALVPFVLNKLFDLGGSDSNVSTDVSVSSEERTSESYKQEFCTAQDNISKRAGFYIRDNKDSAIKKAFEDFPPEHPECDGGNDFCGKSYCQMVADQYHSENTYPYSRCSQACLKAVGEAPSLAAPSKPPPPPTPTPTNTDTCKTDPNSCPSPPEDALTKHPDRTSVVSSVKADLVAQGVNLSNCGAFEITKRVAWELKGESAGLLKKPGGSNCQGFATDIIAYPDGYIYDTLGDGGGANNPQWNPDACGTVATGGICPERYEPAFAP